MASFFLQSVALSSEAEQIEAEPSGGLGAHAEALWAPITGMLAVGLWVQLFGVAALTEIDFSEPRIYAILAYMAPLAFAVAGLVGRSPVLLLGLFTIGFLPGLVLLPGEERALLLEGWSLARVGAMLGLYLAVASAGAREQLVAQPIEALEEDEEASVVVRRVIATRAVALLVILAAPAYAVFQDVGVAAALSVNFPESPQAARSFLALVSFFSWCVCAYMMVLMPALNLEYDQRKLSRALDAMSRDLSAASSARRVGVSVLVALVALAVAWLVAG